MAIPLWLQVGATLLPALLGYNAQAQANRLAQQQYEDAQRRYEENEKLITSMLSGILDPNYSAVSQDLIDAVVGRASQDLDRMQARAYDRALRDLARRGLAGSSLVDQAQAYIGERAADALADARLRAELEAQNLTAGQQAQARSILAGLTSQNMAASQNLANQLLANRQQASDLYSRLAGRLLGTFDWTDLYNPQAKQPTATLSEPVETESASTASTASFQSFAPPPDLGAKRKSRISWRDF